MRLLAHLEQRDQDRLRPHLEPVILEYKRVLYDASQPIEYVYFLEDGVASLVHTMENGDALEVGTISNEGVVGLPVLLGDEQAPSSVFMQVPGSGMRIEANAFRRELERSGAMRAVLLHYAHAFFNQVAQSAACAHFHALEQRCCRWLLMTRDRVKSDQFLLTQEFLSMMLGVRRAGVSIVAGALQRAGLIRYSRGRVTMLDREALEARACECYAVSKAAYNDLLGVADPGNGQPAL
jgi:CRP-like cAMP-binding protein